MLFYKFCKDCRIDAESPLKELFLKVCIQNCKAVLEMAALQGLVAKNDVHFQEKGPFLGSPGQNIVNFQKKRCFLGS